MKTKTGSLTIRVNGGEGRTIIPYEALDYENREMTDVKCVQVELYNDRAVDVFRGKAIRQNDRLQIPEDVTYDILATVRRDACIGVEMAGCEEGALNYYYYIVSILTTSSYDANLKLSFTEREDAVNAYTLISQWILQETIKVNG